MPKVSSYWRQMLLAGGCGALVFVLLLHVAHLLGAPPTNLALWDGTLVTLNLGLATVIGFFAQWAIGTGLAVLYMEWLAPRLPGRNGTERGAVFGLLWWALVMVVGMPIFGIMSPLVRDGIVLAPGFFALHYGIGATIAWLLASVGFGTMTGAWFTVRPLSPG